MAGQDENYAASALLAGQPENCVGVALKVDSVCGCGFIGGMDYMDYVGVAFINMCGCGIFFCDSVLWVWIY